MLGRIDETLLPPSWTREHGPVDPHELAALPTREVELSSARCEEL